MPVPGGLALTLCDAVNMEGATWLPDDSIVFRPGPAVGLWRVPGAGGKPQDLTQSPIKSNEARPIRIYFERAPKGWNRQIPELTVTTVTGTTP